MDRALCVRDKSKQPDYTVFKAAAAISLIADALRDPDLSTKATLRYSPSPNRLQKEKSPNATSVSADPPRRLRGSRATGEVRTSRANACAQLLLALKDDQSAEVLLIARHASVRGEQYARLVPLAETLKKNGRLIGAVVCYRALLVGILARAYARAYSHAAEYLQALRRLDSQIHDYDSLPTHETFEASLRRAHARKASFWNRVD